MSSLKYCQRTCREGGTDPAEMIPRCSSVWNNTELFPPNHPSWEWWQDRKTYRKGFFSPRQWLRRGSHLWRRNHFTGQQFSLPSKVMAVHGIPYQLKCNETTWIIDMLFASKGDLGDVFNYWKNWYITDRSPKVIYLPCENSTSKVYTAR